MHTTTRTGGTGGGSFALNSPFWHSRDHPMAPDPSPRCNASLSDGAAAILTTAGLPAARSPMALADPSAHIARLPLTPPAAQYEAVANHFTALRKRRHRGRYRRSRDASDGRAVRFAGGTGPGCELEPHARPGAGGSADSGLAGGRASKQGRHWASTCIRSRTRCALREGWMRIWLMRCGDPRRGGAFMRPVQAGRPTVWRACVIRRQSCSLRRAQAAHNSRGG